MSIENNNFLGGILDKAKEKMHPIFSKFTGDIRGSIEQVNNSKKGQNSSTKTEQQSRSHLTRRAFLEGVAATAAVATLLPTEVLGATGNGEIQKENIKTTDIKNLEDYQSITLEELNELSLHQKLILLCPKLREKYFFLMMRPSNELTSILLESNITINTEFFEHGSEFNKKLSLADIIPEEINSLKTNNELVGFRIRDEFSDSFTAGEFYTSLRPHNWKEMSRRSKHRAIQQHQDFKPDDRNRLRFDNETIIQCKESFETQHTSPNQYLINELEINEETLNLEKQKLIAVIGETNENNEFKFISKNMRAGDIFTMNIGVLRLLAKLIEEFGEIIKISSARRSKDNNRKSKGSSQSKHLMGIGFDIVGATDFTNTNDKIVENVETWLIAHGYDKIMKLLSHGSNYHLHAEPIGESTMEELLNEAENEHQKSLDPDLRKTNPFEPYTSKRTPGKILRRLSLSDIRLLKATNYAPEVACSFCNGWERKEALAIFSSRERVKEMVEEAQAA